MQKSLTVCVTGAAGQIAYSFIPQLMSGNIFSNTKIDLRLLDITSALGALKGVAMEVKDCNYKLLNSIKFTDKPTQAFENADVIIFIGGFPRKKGMQRKDLLKMNKQIFVQHSKALRFAKQDVKCVVVANPCNTNATILATYSNIKKQNITCLSRLDHNRAYSQIAEKTGSSSQQIQGIFVFGNHSLTQYPCITHIKVKGKPIQNFVDRQWLQKTFIPKVQKRGGQILGVKGSSSVFSAANAIVDHMRDWYEGTNKIVAMGVRSNGQYGIPAGLWSSMPVKCNNFKYQIVSDIALSQFCKQKIAITSKQLKQQLRDAQVQTNPNAKL